MQTVSLTDRFLFTPLKLKSDKVFFLNLNLFDDLKKDPSLMLEIMKLIYFIKKYYLYVQNVTLKTKKSR